MMTASAEARDPNDPLFVRVIRLDEDTRNKIEFEFNAKNEPEIEEYHPQSKLKNIVLGIRQRVGDLMLASAAMGASVPIILAPLFPYRPSSILEGSILTGFAIGFFAGAFLERYANPPKYNIVINPQPQIKEGLLGQSSHFIGS